MTRRPDTKSLILDVAEQLFAEHGFNDTSLRLITSDAGVNLASVNYHFGSKKALIQAVLARYLDNVMPALRDAMNELLAREQVQMTEVFGAFVGPLLSLGSFRPAGTGVFMQLLGRGYTEKQGHLRRFITAQYGDALGAFMAAVKKATPGIPDNEVFWRLHFTLGTVVFTMASSMALTEIAESDFGEKNSIESLIHRLVPYLASAVTAPLPVAIGNSQDAA
ncbi:TetR/AcrR family transcriptional regulator [Gallaecimonas xiamenensis]|uniref:TetR family transcriptional regulator n=1 Tax=Gallaecimonas xiamenensis 3-C-1 TaxID=745411 RepID=K2JKK9_9GAMM|nr:TetR/AcrR family transcriptional regulator [Gallaecimonas xiamenensis]EKE71074.1 TetR family transcriptional regulator [Gallaecimonas xiamenensis 3-C-1]